MKLPLYQVDAFTTRVFSGNPAAVVLLEEWLPDHVLLAIAAENNLSETAFVIPRGEVLPLRWFTPTLEVDLCGHATLAAAYVVLRECRPSAKDVTFETRSGRLTVARDGPELRMDFPARPGQPVDTSDAIVRALGARPREVRLARDVLAVFDDEATIRALAPDMVGIAALDAFAVIVTAPGDQVDFVSRFFAPKAGVPEDPVTGSAHCTLAPYWAERLGRTTLTGRQISRRGGELRCELRGDRVTMAGSAVEYLRGQIDIPDPRP